MINHLQISIDRNIIYYKRDKLAVAQLVRAQDYKPGVGGSDPPRYQII